MFILFISETETEHERGGAERQGDTESEAGSRLRAVSTEPDEGLELRNWKQKENQKQNNSAICTVSIVSLVVT